MSPVAFRVRELLRAFPDEKAIIEFIDRSDRTRVDVLEMYYERVEEVRNENLHAALILAELGVDLSRDVMRFASLRERALIKAKALGVCGGVHRTLAGDSRPYRDSHWRKAEGAYTVAYRHLKPYLSKPPIELVELYGRWAFLRRDQRRFEEARLYARRSLEIAESAGDSLWIPRAMVFLANTHVTEGDVQRGISIYEEALRRISGASDPLFYRAAIQSLAVAFCQDDAPRKIILKTISEFRPMALETPPGSLMRAHLHWLEGLFHFQKDEFPLSKEAFVKAQRIFVDSEMGYYAALVSMDLALTLLALGDVEATRQLATDIIPVFESLHVGREIIRTLRIFVKATEDNALTAELVEMIKRDILGSRRR